VAEFRKSNPDDNAPWRGIKVWKALLITFFTILLAIGLLNCVADPFGIYGTGIFPTLAFSQYDHKYRLFSDYEPKPEVLIIGSSRVGYIDPGLVTELTGKRCFNWAMPAAKTEIYYSVLRIAIEEFDAPIDTVIVGVDPEAFHPGTEIHPQARTLRIYMRYFSEETFLSILREKVLRLFTIEQTLSSIEVIWKELTGQQTAYFITWGPDGCPVDVDYSIAPDKYIENPDERLEHGIITDPQTTWHPERFNGLSDECKYWWEEFLKICDEKEIQVYAFIPPYHPRLLENLMRIDAGPIFDETRSYLESTVTGSGGTYRDYSIISTFNGDPENFLDETHPEKENIDLLVRDLLLN